MSVFTIARLTFLEARRRRLFQLVLLMGVAFVALFAVGYYLIHSQSRFSMVGERLEVSNILLLMGLYAANFLGVVLGGGDVGGRDCWRRRLPAPCRRW